MFNIKNFSLITILIGTVIGAGFASGAEIWTFFGKFGVSGFWGILLCGIIIAVVSSGILKGAVDNEYSDFYEFCTMLCGKLPGRFFYILGVIFMFSAFCIMLAGSGSIFAQELNLNYILGVFVMAILTYFTFLFGARGIATVNIILTPLMVAGIIILGVYSVIWDTRSVAVTFSDLIRTSGALTSALVYVSYNFLCLPPVVISSKNLISSGKDAIFCGTVTGLILGVCGLLMYAASLTPSFAKTAVPALTLANKIGKNFKLFYGLTIYFSMFTTAIGNFFGFVNSIYVSNISKKILALLVCILASSVALLGFTFLINTLYVVIGYASLVLTFFLISYSVKKLIAPTTK